MPTHPALSSTIALPSRYPARSILAAAFGILSAIAPATAQIAAVAPGDAAITKFSGTKAQGQPAENEHPLDRTFIDLDGTALQVMDLQNLGGGPSGQLGAVKTVLSIKARDIGQVFGVTLVPEADGNRATAYAAATSLYGLQIVKGDRENPQRLVKGEPGARWMPGQFGPGGGAGAIWKIDGDGTASLFAEVATGGKANGGAGLGGLAYDAKSRQIFVADLASGLIHRFSLDGKERGIFDHGTVGRAAAGLPELPRTATAPGIESPDFSVEDPSSWGYADSRRMTFALAISERRLFYSVAAGPEVWSVGLTANGGFDDDPRREIEVGAPASATVTGLVFDGPDVLYVAQRGQVRGSYDYSTFADPQRAVVFRYVRDPKTKAWSAAADETTVGFKPPHRGTTGGVALGYGYNDSGSLDPDRCQMTLWTTGEHLREGDADPARIDGGGPRIVHGLQGNAKDRFRQSQPLIRPVSQTVSMLDLKYQVQAVDETPWATWFADADGRFDDPAVDGHMGNVAIFSPCAAEAVAEIAPTLMPRIVSAGEPEPDVSWPPLPPPGLDVTKTAPAACLPGGACTFTITVTNVGALPFAGNVLFTDGMFVGGGGAGAPITSIVPPLGCGPDPVALPFSCIAPMVLAPGQAKAFAVTVTMPAAPPSYWAHNCFAVSDPLLPPPALPPLGLEPPVSATSCAWVPVGAPPPQSNLQILKTALHAGKCGKTLPGPVMACDYDITIHNAGPSAFAGPLQMDETVPAGATLTSIGVPFACAGGPPAYNCTAPAVALPSAASLVVPVTVKIPLAPLEAGGCVVPNQVKIATPAGGTASNTNPLDDTAVALADGFMSWILEDGTTFVTCDPTNLKTTKIAKGDCTAGACEFLVTVTNLGPDPFHGPIKLDDKFGFAPAAVAFSESWNCALGGSSYQCTYPHADLESPGDKVELTIKATLPETRRCAIANTATMTFPLAGTRFNQLGEDDSATATAATNAPGCAKDEAEPAPTCADGSPVPKNGRCPRSTPLDREPPVIVTPQPDPGCRRGDQRCRCEQQGRVWTGARCVDTPTPGDDCKRRGGRWNGTRCVNQDPIDPAVECRRKGWVWTGARCERPADLSVLCRAKGGIWTGARCIDPPPRVCPPGTVGRPPNCRPEVRQCPPGLVGRYPNCRKLEVKQCPPGTVGRYPNCRKIEVPQCPPGTIGRPPNCRKLDIRQPRPVIKPAPVIKQQPNIGPLRRPPQQPTR